MNLELYALDFGGRSTTGREPSPLRPDAESGQRQVVTLTVDSLLWCPQMWRRREPSPSPSDSKSSSSGLQLAPGALAILTILASRRGQEFIDFQF